MDATIATSETSERLRWKRSGFWRRFAASLLDGILLGVVNVILTIIIGRPAAAGLNILISLAYFTYFHGRTGQTPGDAALGIRVVDLRDGTGGPIGYGRAAIRWLMSIVSFVAIFIGFLWMIWDAEKQTWHDKVAGSVVIPASLERYD
jgi:uncharacterized RDD family membrane protein YckC